MSKDSSILTDFVPGFDSAFGNFENKKNIANLYGTSETTQTLDNFNDNLAEKMSSEALKNLSSYLLDVTKEDIESRQDWMDAVEKVSHYLGLEIEDTATEDHKNRAKTYDTTLLTALIRFVTTAAAEFLHADGVAGAKINGQSNEVLEQKLILVRDYLNYYLTTIDKAFYSDFRKFLMYLGLYGCGFRKIWFDPILKRPISRFIAPKDFIINSDCNSVLESTRYTHVQFLSKRDIILNIKNGIYRDVELPYLKTGVVTNENNKTNNNISKELDISVYKNPSTYTQYEHYVYLNLEEFNHVSVEDKQNNVPLPYIVTIDLETEEILAIRKNWKQSDPNRERRSRIIQYNFLEGFGVLGLGLAQLVGTNAIAATKIQRQLIDAGIFKNFPGGLMNLGGKEQKSVLAPNPGEFLSVNVGGTAIQDSFMPFPYSEPSQVLMALRDGIIAQTRELASTSEMGMLDSKEDISTGTALAFLEVNNRIQSAVLQSIHHSFTHELQIINEIFSETLEREQFYGNNQTQEITANDYADEIAIIPVSDPTVNSVIQRVMRAQAVMQLAQQAPDLHNMPNVFKLNYKAQGMNDKEIENILLPIQEPMEILPLDPISENQNILLKKPVKAAIWQLHDAHILSHGLFAEEHLEVQPIIMDHIQEHQAMKYLIQMQQMLGFELPPLDQLQDPEIQNQIAMQITNLLEQSRTQEQEQPMPIDPNTLLMADIEQKKAETEAKLEIAKANIEQKKAETEAKLEIAKANIESAEDIAKLKSETELIKHNES